MLFRSAEDQHDIIINKGNKIMGDAYFNMIINRKGTRVAVMAWDKAGSKRDENFIKSLERLY